MAYEQLLTSTDDLLKVSSYVHDHFEAGGKSIKVVITESSGTGKWGMARLWYSWLGVVAKYMADNGVKMPLMISKEGKQYGRRPFNQSDAHELFTAQFLGLNEKGERLSWKKSEGDNVADKGQRFMAMLKLQDWCMEKGINLPMPRESEFSDLINKQNS